MPGLRGFQCSKRLINPCFWVEAGRFDPVWACFKLVLSGVRTRFVPVKYPSRRILAVSYSIMFEAQKSPPFGELKDFAQSSRP